MVKKRTLSVAELKSFLFVHLSVDRAHSEKLDKRFQLELGNNAVKKENPEDAALNIKIMDWLSDLLARRLKRNRRDTPLLSSRDFDEFLSTVMGEAIKIGVDARRYEEMKMFARMMFEVYIETVNAKPLSGENIYKETWRWITTVLDVAAERGILPNDLLVIEDATDEVTRRMYSKSQYFDRAKDRVDKFTNVDRLKKILIQPMLDMDKSTGADKEEDRREAEKFLEAMIMPQLRLVAEKLKVVAFRQIDEDATRIYKE